MRMKVKREFVPEELKEVYVDFYWSQKKLWEFNLPTVSLEIKCLDWILDYPIWYMDQYPVPSMIIEKPDLDINHWRRIQDSDLNFPIHVLRWKNQLLILDGIHRLIKAKLSGSLTINAKILNEEHIQEILPSEEDFKNGFLKQFNIET